MILKSWTHFLETISFYNNFSWNSIANNITTFFKTWFDGNHHGNHSLFSFILNLYSSIYLVKCPSSGVVIRPRNNTAQPLGDLDIYTKHKHLLSYILSCLLNRVHHLDYSSCWLEIKPYHLGLHQSYISSFLCTYSSDIAYYLSI